MKELVLLAIVPFAGNQAHAQQLGNGAASSSYTGKSNNWQGWTFVGGAVAAAVSGILVIATSGDSNQTTHAHSH